MENVMNMFENETQLLQTECAFDVAMKRIEEKYPEAGRDEEGVWNAMALCVINEGYEAAMHYARNTRFGS